MNIFNLIATLSLSTSEYDKGINDAKKKNNSLEKNNASNNKSGRITYLIVCIF